MTDLKQKDQAAAAAPEGASPAPDLHSHEHSEHAHEHPHEHPHEHSHEHSHEHGACSCGHTHAHSEHSHEHSHEHGACSCGHTHSHSGHSHEHPHEHSHEHGACSCGHTHSHSGHSHEHAHDSGEHRGPVRSTAPCTVYMVENIDCAHCAASIESKIRELPEVEDAVLTFATRQLRVYSSSGPDLLPRLREIADRIEPGTVITVREKRKVSGSQESHEAGKHKSDKIDLLAGAVLFLAGEVLSEPVPAASVLCFVAAYLVLGREVLMTALKNMKNGHVMDENFLMSIATIGAFLIRQFDEAVGVMLFYRIGEAFEHRAVEKSRSQIMEAADLRPEVVLCEEFGEVHEIPAEDAVKGQILHVRPGDRIPLDGVVLEGESRIDTSPITGEPVPVAVYPGSPVTSGCVNTSGLIKIRVEKELSESMVTRILDSVENAAASKPQVERFITRFARVYTPFVVFLAAATAVIPSLFTGNWSHWIYTALTFLVISCPCALVLSVPLAFFSGIGAGSRQGILFKGGAALEALKGVRTVIMDKTGTITRGEFAVQSVCPVPGITEEELLSHAASCEASSSHPIGASILAAAAEQGIAFVKPEQVEEIPGKGIRAVLPSGEFLCGNRKLLEAFGADCHECPVESSAATMVYLAKDGRYVGSVSISDALKPEAASAVSSLKSSGIRTAMLTGDSEASASEAARAAGIDLVYAHLLPDEKLKTLQNLRETYGSCMYVGDGINDAPVLAGADVGAAMGSGADAAIEAADVVFMTSSVEAIPASIRIARQVGRIAWQNVVFALAVKALVMVLGLLGFASMWMAVFADSGVAMLCVLNSIRVLYLNRK